MYKFRGDGRSHSSEKWEARLQQVRDCIAAGEGARHVAKLWGTSTAYVHQYLGKNHPDLMDELRNVMHGRALPQTERNRRFFLHWAFKGYPWTLSLFINPVSLRVWISQNGGVEAAEDWCELAGITPEQCRYEAGNALYNVAQMISP